MRSKTAVAPGRRLWIITSREDVALKVTYIERPTDPLQLLPFMGLHLIALRDGLPDWGGQLIAITDKAHIRKYSGEIAEFSLTETVFKCVQAK